MPVKYSIIIPTLDEKEGIAWVISRIPEQIANDAEIIVVDAGTDKTAQIAESLNAKVIRSQKRGKGYQIRLGAKAATGDTIVIMDGDGEHNPQYIPKLLEKLDECDIVLGARAIINLRDIAYTLVSLFSDIFTRSIFTHVGLKIKGEPLTGFRAMKRATWKKLELHADDFLIETEMNIRALNLGLKIGEVRIPYVMRVGGILKSKFLQDPLQWVRIWHYLLKVNKQGLSAKP